MRSPSQIGGNKWLEGVTSSAIWFLSTAAKLLRLGDDKANQCLQDRLGQRKKTWLIVTSGGDVLIIQGKFSVLLLGGLPVSKKIKLIPLPVTEVVGFFSNVSVRLVCTIQLNLAT